jgi:hypothetical protein
MVYWNDGVLGRSTSINDSSMHNPTWAGKNALFCADEQLIHEQGPDQEFGGTSDGSSRLQSKQGSFNGRCAGVPESNGRFFAGLRLKKRENCTQLQRAYVCAGGCPQMGWLSIRPS